MKKLLSILISVVMLFTVIGSIIVARAEETTYSILDVKDQIRTVGRTEDVDSGIACDWTASGIEFTAVCEENASIALSVYANAECYFTVFIDDVRQNYRVRTLSGTYTPVIASAENGLTAGTHKIKIIKQTERTIATVNIKSFVLNNAALGDKPAEPQYIFESIGDSITSGFGSLDTNNQAAKYSDGTRTYAFITAQNFGAESRVTSVSGGSINSLYTQYIKNTRDSNAFDYSAYKKPNVVTIAFGTNDGAKTVDYWQTGIKNFADAIRTGYNDYNIPIVMVQNLMSNGDDVRANIAQAIRNLESLDAEKYSSIFVTHGTSPTGGHPAQANHKSAADKLTRDLVEFGIMPASALRSDATVTLTEQTAEEETLNKFDSVVAPGSNVTGITGELVSPLDPADAESETAKAVKYTADGTQSATTDYRYPQVKAGLVYNKNSTETYRTKGISFYINYKDTTDYTDIENPTLSKPQLLLTAGDKKATISLDAEDSTTQKVTIYWNTMPNASYVFTANLIYSNNLNVCLEMSGACEYTIDNMQVLLNKYTYSANADCAYTYTSGYDSYEVIGILDGYEATTTEPSSSVTSSTGSSDIDTSGYYEPSDVATAGNWEAGQYDMNNGEKADNATRARLKKLVKVETGKTYTFKIDNNTVGVKYVLREYNTSGTFIKSYGTVESGGTYTPSSSSVGFISVTLYDNSSILSLITNGTLKLSMTANSETTSSTSTTTTTTTTTTVPEGSGLCKIGDVEYASLFGSDGAIANAVDGDRIVMVYDETYVFDPASTGASLASISKNITIDLAGHTVNVTRTNTTRGILFINYAALSIESTVDGLGVTNTATKGIIKGVATIVKVSADFSASNVELRSSLGDDSYGFAIDSGKAGVKISLKDTVLYAPKNTIYVTGGNAIFDVQDSTIYAQYYPLRSQTSSSMTYEGEFRNCEIYATNAYGPQIKVNNLILDNCNLYVNGSDQTLFDHQTGVLTLKNGTVIDGKDKAKRCIKINTGATLVTDNATIKTPKNGASDAYAIYNSGTAILGDTVISVSNKANTSNQNLYSSLAEGKAIYTTDVPSEASLLAEDYDYTAIHTTIYVRDSLSSGFTVTIDGVEQTVSNGTVTMPLSDTDGFLAYTDGTNYYQAGQTVPVDSDMTLTTVATGKVDMVEGASIRLNKVNGIRFYTSIDQDKVAQLREAGYTVELGTLIAPRDMLEEKELSFESGVTYAQVKYESSVYFTENDFSGVVGSIVNIKDSNAYNAETGNIGREFVGRGYVKVSKDGVVIGTSYADYSNNDISNNSRSIAFIANSFKTLSSDIYNALAPEIKALVDKWDKVYTDSNI